MVSVRACAGRVQPALSALRKAVKYAEPKEDGIDDEADDADVKADDAAAEEEEDAEEDGGETGEGFIVVNIVSYMIHEDTLPTPSRTNTSPPQTITANYTISSTSTSTADPWKICDATKKSTCRACSVFVFDRKSPDSDGSTLGRSGTAAFKIYNDGY